MTEDSQFIAWLIQNEDHLKTYSIEEMRNVALACGWSRSLVTELVTEYVYGEKGAR